ncbi:type II toxin-antitoxin system HicA family toxin [Methylocaldum sp.]|uniref:type II toxin-antitoxin system HicA family toxin n=1 Tax=Methylocaldum sp. TaxID=1969727 RepID=UPI002D3B1707|nr:type II toxin-antitoxin system HicA family toxin [Methylocaldum sp.]HYE37273.1 type II toxin-antitoxin system HicA family toxin [Methylocaldum sp.]
MKRLDLLRHLEAHGCRLIREGGNHSVYINPVARKVSAIPRHREINEFLASKIRKDLDVPSPKA